MATDIIARGVASSASAKVGEQISSHFRSGSNIQIVDNPDGTQTINASGEVSAEDTVARAEIADIKDGETLDSFGDVETALADKVDKETGKGLSTNDYTTTEKTKLAGIAEGAEVNKIEGIKVNNTTINPDANKVVNITVPTTAAEVSALPDTTKYAASLSLTINASTFVVTAQLKDQNGDSLGSPQTIDLPLESVVVGGSYDDTTKKVVLSLQNGNTVEFSVADLVAGLQTELSATNKLNPAYIEYDSAHRAVSDTEKSTWNGKQTALSSTQLAAVNSGITEEGVAQIETNKNNILFNARNGVVNMTNISDITLSSDGYLANKLYFNASASTYRLKSTINGGTAKYTVVARIGNTEVYRDDTTISAPNIDHIFTLSTAADSISIWVQLQSENPVAISDTMVYPAALGDISYQPYAPSNAELYAMVQALQAQLANQ